MSILHTSTPPAQPQSADAYCLDAALDWPWLVPDAPEAPDLQDAAWLHDWPFVIPDAERHTPHTEARRQDAERAGSLAALVCNAAWRMQREL